MSELARLLRSVRDVVDDGPAFALVGGFAVSVRTEPRFTRDVDVAMAVGSDAEAEATTQRFLRHGYRVTAVVEHDTAGRLATARLSDTTGGMVDLLFASSGIEREIVARAEALEVVRGVEVPVATTGDLIALKLLSVSDERPTDATDLRALLSVASPTEPVRTARRARARSSRRKGEGRSPPAPTCGARPSSSRMRGGDIRPGAARSAISSRRSSRSGRCLGSSTAWRGVSPPNAGSDRSTQARS